MSLYRSYIKTLFRIKEINHWYHLLERRSCRRRVIMTGRVEYVFDSMRITNIGDDLILSDTRNFITPTFPVDYWREPTFYLNEKTTPESLDVRRKAAAAALDNLTHQKLLGETDIEDRLYPLEQQVLNVANALASLEEVAREAETADAEMDKDTRPLQSNGGSRSDETPGGLEVQITKNDTPLAYETNLAIDFLTMVYLGRAAGSNGISFGSWYRALQDRLITDRPLTTRSIDYRDGRMSKTFMTATIMSLQSCARLYIGNRAYSAFECAVLCLHLLHRELDKGIMTHPPTTFSDLIEHLPTSLDIIANTLGTMPSGRVIYIYNIDKLPRHQFQAPNGGRYEHHALEDHSVLNLLLQFKVLPPIPGHIKGGPPAIAIDIDQTAFVDPVNRAAAAFLGRAHNLFLTEDQTLLRATINTITSLLLLRRLLWNGNIYTDKLRNNFQLGTLIPQTASIQMLGTLTRGATGGDLGAPLTIKSESHNLEFLCSRYILPIYTSMPDVEITQLFPGLTALCLDAQALIAQTRTARRVVQVKTGRLQDNLIRLVGLELENRRRTGTVPIGEVITAHDAISLQTEHGLGLLMQQPRLRASLEENHRLWQFNIGSDYDLIYFLCLGYIPQFTASI
ncbi:DNA packaging tegument protein UL25 [Felid alphaherpesvirus 1]|uniref:DNA packaging tegument protein UL25 n=1 Tax=Feline herpesvirus 1 TaxID=10334 RepID=D1FXV7_FHV1|nr:DNA packaging tegument protein UL25 [Felid alphaherpesvirus 1]AMN88967.1 DNA packaging tegument protein UL25 [synthetic construct]ACT88333.1 DNA packaging tegument protein UL25 [Felid alphaherpesvirus 1]ALJ84075.1 DNA packaging tegument protein UL25 [Felid alphaherpesvirus 1]ALJ84151.1 DNA packaging tegument protein UL25 [Felid alphaherpesvirus 1]ALJ84227.1 DNA packaging tegument protein UL25 [Felid alphaherpesvirus 1]